jgi:hypothetical protein
VLALLLVLALSACGTGPTEVSDFELGRRQGVEDSQKPEVCDIVVSYHDANGSDLEATKRYASLEYFKAWGVEHQGETGLSIPSSGMGNGWAQGVLEACDLVDSG